MSTTAPAAESSNQFNTYDLLNPPSEVEASKHKLDRLVQLPNSYFMDVKHPGCYKITTVFSHISTPVFCSQCNFQIAESTGGKTKLTEGCSFRKKAE